MIANIDKCPGGMKFFEIYGFDIILDQKLGPWLLEINIHPSFQPSSTLDDMIKTCLLTDTLHLLGLPCPQKKTLRGLHRGKSEKPHKTNPFLSDDPNIKLIENTIRTNIEETERGSRFRKVYPHKGIIE